MRESDFEKVGDAYKLLGVDRSAPRSLIEFAYRIKIKKLNPEKVSGDERQEINEMIDRLTLAFNILLSCREEYNRWYETKYLKKAKEPYKPEIIGEIKFGEEKKAEPEKIVYIREHEDFFDAVEEVERPEKYKTHGDDVMKYASKAMYYLGKGVWEVGIYFLPVIGGLKAGAEAYRVGEYGFGNLMLGLEIFKLLVILAWQTVLKDLPEYNLLLALLYLGPSAFQAMVGWGFSKV